MSTLSINISLEEINKMVFDRLDPKLSEELRMLIANTIVNNLQKSPVGIEQTYKSFLGLEAKLSYSVGDMVYVKRNNLYSWRFHKDLMEDRFFKGGLLVRITETDLYNREPYSIEYTYVNQSGEEERTTQTVSEESILGLEDSFPLNM